MNGLATLIKLQKTRVDEQRVQLAKLQSRLNEVLTEIAALEIEKAREQVVAEQNAEATTTYGMFLKRAVQHGRQLEKDREVAAHAVEVARDQLNALFEEQKRYEIAEDARLTKAQQEETRRETIELDEIGSVFFARKNNE